MHETFYPGYEISDEEKDTILETMRSLPWWSTNPNEFPQLPSTSRQLPTHSIIGRISGNWQKWHFLDKFAELMLEISASAPYLNQDKSSRGSEETVKASEMISLQLAEFTSHLDVEMKGKANEGGTQIIPATPKSRTPLRKRKAPTEEETPRRIKRKQAGADLSKEIKGMQ